MPDLPTTPDPLKGALAGFAAGLLASLMMNQFQAVAQRSMRDSGDEDEPATEQAADAVVVAASGKPVPEARKPAAGSLVHYAFGAALGVGYGLVAEYRREITTGFGTGYGLAVAAVADDGAVPALGLGPPPTDTPLAMHLYSAASHIVFGTILEGTRRLVRTRL